MLYPTAHPYETCRVAGTLLEQEEELPPPAYPDGQV